MAAMSTPRWPLPKAFAIAAPPEDDISVNTQLLEDRMQSALQQSTLLGAICSQGNRALRRKECQLSQDILHNAVRMAMGQDNT